MIIILYDARGFLRRITATMKLIKMPKFIFIYRWTKRCRQTVRRPHEWTSPARIEKRREPAWPKRFQAPFHNVRFIYLWWLIITHGFSSFRVIIISSSFPTTKRKQKGFGSDEPCFEDFHGALLRRTDFKSFDIRLAFIDILISPLLPNGWSLMLGHWDIY